MARPKAATPAAHIRAIVRFFDTASLELADVAFELARGALAERKARKKGEKEKPKTRVIVQALAVPDSPPAAQTATAVHQTPPAATPPAPPTHTTAATAPPAAKKRTWSRKKKQPPPAGKKRGADRPTSRPPVDGGPTETAATAALPEQHPVDEQAEPPDGTLTW